MLKKKKKKDPLLTEARKVLLNQVELDKDGNFVTTTELRFQLWGASDGEDKIRTLGISTRHYFYNSDHNNTQAVFKTRAAMANIGRRIKLRTIEDSAACLIKTYIFYPVVLVFRENKFGDLQLTVFTPRTLTAPIAEMLAVKKLEKAADGIISRMVDEVPRYDDSGYDDYDYDFNSSSEESADEDTGEE